MDISLQILRNSTEREVKKYDCCEEPYPSLKFHLTLQRRFKVTDQGVIRNPRMSQGCNSIGTLECWVQIWDKISNKTLHVQTCHKTSNMTWDRFCKRFWDEKMSTELHSRRAKRVHPASGDRTTRRGGWRATTTAAGMGFNTVVVGFTIAKRSLFCCNSVLIHINI